MLRSVNAQSTTVTASGEATYSRLGPSMSRMLALGEDVLLRPQEEANNSPRASRPRLWPVGFHPSRPLVPTPARRAWMESELQMHCAPATPDLGEQQWERP